MGYQIEQSSTIEPMQFLMILAADNKTGATGLTPTVTIRKNGAPGFVPPAGSIVELGFGWYEVTPNQGNYTNLGPLLLHATDPTTVPTDDRYDIVPRASSLVVAGTPGQTGGRPVSGNDLITKALKHIGVISGLEVPTADEAEDSFAELNNMIDSWGIERLTIYEERRTQFVNIPIPAVNPTTGLSSMTLGPGGDLDVTPRPQWVKLAGIVTKDTALTPLELPLQVMNIQNLADIPTKGTTSRLPTRIYIDGAWPLRNVTLWPIPNVTSLDLILYIPQMVNYFSDRTTQFSFPPGYVDALCYNLAVRLAPQFSKNPSPIVMENAEEGLARIKRSNANKDTLGMDPALGQRGSARTFNWRSGDTV